MTTYDVVVAGAGPVVLMLAAEFLQGQGIPSQPPEAASNGKAALARLDEGRWFARIGTFSGGVPVTAHVKLNPTLVSAGVKFHFSFGGAK